MTPDLVTSCEADHVLTLTLSRPDKHNALNTEMLCALGDALGRATGVGAVVLTGAGTTFCAGADIGEYARASTAAFGRFTERANAVCARISTLEIPVIAAVNGPALGGGFELALSCDLVFATRSASFGLPETSLGLIPGWGGTQRLTWHLGPNRAKELMFSGRRLSADQAHELGLVSQVCAASELLDHAREYGRRLATGPTQAFAAVKRAVNHSAPAGWHGGAGYAVEQAELRALFDTRDGQEGIRAFVDKRPARFGESPLGEIHDR